LQNDSNICYNNTIGGDNMFDIYISEAAFENCSPEKEKIDMIIPYTVFHYIISGEGYFNGQKLGAGYFFSANKNDKICYYPDKNNPWSYFWVRIYGNECKKAMEKCNLDSGAFMGSCQNLNEISKLIKLYTDNKNSGIDIEYFAKAAANMLISMHTKKTSVTVDDYKSVRKKHVMDISEYINNNYYKQIKIEDISKQFFLNRGYIRNIFIEYIHQSPKQYLQKIRMERAAELLRETSLNISVIARSVGYDDQLLFSKMFSRFFGCSPTDYRQKKRIIKTKL